MVRVDLGLTNLTSTALTPLPLDGEAREIGMSDEKPPKPAASGAMRMAGAGMELAATIGVACLVGYWIDRKFETEPWGLLILAGLGILGGLYNLVRPAIHAMIRPPDENPPTRGSGEEGNPSDKS